MAVASKQLRRQIAARKGAETMTRARVLWAALAAATTAAILVATPTLATIAGITLNAID